MHSRWPSDRLGATDVEPPPPAGGGTPPRYDAPVTEIPPELLDNLAVLDEVDPMLARRIRWPCASDHVARTDSGVVEYRVHRTWHRLTLTPEEVTRELDGVPGDEVLLFGLGLGELLDAALERAGVVHAWERDPWLVRRTLGRGDLAEPLRSGRLRLHLTTDLLDLIDAGPPAEVVVHPLLGDVYRHERRLLRDGVLPRRAMLAVGGLLVDDVADALRAEGLSPVPWDLHGWSAEELAFTARAAKAEVAVAINFTHGLAEACAELDLPVRVWEIDPATDEVAPHETTATAQARIGTWRAAHVAVFETAGFTDVLHLPLAANPDRRSPKSLTPALRDRYEAPVVFVGASMVNQAMEHRRRLVAAHVLGRGGDPSAAVEEVEAAIEFVLAAQREDFSVYRVPELLEEVLPGLANPRSEAALQALGGDRPDALLGELAAADKRITYVANLGQVGAEVWGDDGWTHVEQYGTAWRGPAGHGDELSTIYSTTGIHLDVGRIYQSDIVTMRVFDVLACGGFCLAEWSPELGDYFAIGEELDCYRTLQELLDKVAFWLEAGEDQRRAVGMRGRERVLRDHTIRQRVRRLLG